ncbi:MAG: DUF456 family protein [Syntrophobacteraceae bacterium]
MHSLGLALVIFFMVLGFIGAFLPLLPGPLLVWLAALTYVVATDFRVIGYGAFSAMTIIAAVSSTAEVWMPLLGAKVLGGSGKGLLYGIAGSIIGFAFFHILGAMVGYAVGILYGEYRRQGNWRKAIKASFGGLAGWGVSTAVQAAGSLLIMGIFFWRVFGWG